MAAQWSSEQLANARTIMNVGRQVGASDRDIQIALMAAWQESGMRSLSYGDGDSVGLFQQRNAWASRAARMDPAQAARMFFLGGSQGQRGLLSFNNRDQMGLGQAAQKVQVSAYPDSYDQWQQRSQEMLAALGAGTGTSQTVAPPTGDASSTLPGMLGTPVQVDPATTPLGVDAAAGPVDGGPIGLGSFSAMGVQSADQTGTGTETGTTTDLMDSYLPPTGAGGFDQVFPKTGTVGGTRQRVVDFAKTLLGTPYVWGGTDPATGLDCSGFTQLSLKQIGINLPRISAAQAQYGKRTDIANLQPGDLVAWDNSSRNNGADHIAIYMGNGQIIEEPRPGLAVRIRTLDANEGAWGVALNY